METPGLDHSYSTTGSDQNYCTTPGLPATDHDYCTLLSPDHNYCATPGSPGAEHNYYKVQKHGVEEIQSQLETHPRLYVSGLRQWTKSCQEASGNSVYQATPAVGDDGQNILRLVPIQIPSRLPTKYPEPQKAVATKTTSAPVQTVKTDALHFLASQQLKQLSLRNHSSNLVPVSLSNTPSKYSLLQQPLNSTANLPQTAVSASNRMRLAGPPRKLPVTMKSPARPSAQNFKLLSKALLQIVSATKLPQDNKKQTVTPSASFTISPGSHSALSPITTVNQGQSDPVLHSLNKNESKTSCGSQKDTILTAVPGSSSNGIFYQATPAVGADGKNIIKLVPVQTVNRQLPQSHISQPKRYPEPQKAAAIKVTSARAPTVRMDASHPRSVQQLKPLPPRRHSSKLVPVPLGNTPSKDSLLQQPLNSTADLPQLAGPPRKLPVLSNAPLPAVPAPKPPQHIEKPTATPSANSTISPGSTSPVTQGQSDPAPHTHNKTESKPSYGFPVKRNQRLKLVPKESQRPNSPIKWTVEEEDCSDAPSLDPPFHPAEISTTEVAPAVAHRENDTSCDVPTKPASPPSERWQEEENTLFLCDGKVFFVQKKGSPALPAEHDAAPTAAAAAAKTYEFNRVTKALLRKSPEPAECEIRRVIIVSDDCDDVIDLCDDGVCAPASPPPPPPEEDNVIFVSYVAPKTGQASTGSSDTVTQQQQRDHNSLDGVIEERPRHSAPGSTAESLHNDSQHSTHSSSSSSIHSIQSATTPSSTATPSTAESRQRSDRLLRRRFHIRAEARICLQRIDEVLHPGHGGVGDDPGPRPHAAPVGRPKLESQDAQPAPLGGAGDQHVGFVEPIEEDFLTDAKDSGTETPADASAGSRRMGRTRKRTICPCCVPGAEAAVLRFSHAEAQAQALMWASVHKRRGRPKGSKDSVNCFRSRMKKSGGVQGFRCKKRRERDKKTQVWNEERSGFGTDKKNRRL